MSTDAKPAYGGQALVEGVLMRGKTKAAVAVRAPGGGIVMRTEQLNPAIYGSKLFRLPLLRGLTLLWDTLVVGMRALFFAAGVQAGDTQTTATASNDAQADRPQQNRAFSSSANPSASTPLSTATSGPNEATAIDDTIKTGEIGGAAVGVTILVSLAFAIGLFFVVPALIANGAAALAGTGDLEKANGWTVLAVNLFEGLIRLAIFLGYLWLLGRQEQTRRVFQYHGAEHKTIAAYEADVPLVPASVQRFSTLHPRCGTAFTLFVLVIAVFVFAFLGNPPLWLRLISRVLLVPVIATVAYEFLRWSAKHQRNPVIRFVTWPNLALQKMTTREPDDAMVEVAITAFNQLLYAEGHMAPTEWNAFRRSINARYAEGNATSPAAVTTRV